MMSRWETMAANLPIIQQRLIALSELHQQGKYQLDRSLLQNENPVYCIQHFNSVRLYPIMTPSNKR
jgi:hypothetical protein